MRHSNGFQYLHFAFLKFLHFHFIFTSLFHQQLRKKINVVENWPQPIYFMCLIIVQITRNAMLYVVCTYRSAPQSQMQWMDQTACNAIQYDTIHINIVFLQCVKEPSIFASSKPQIPHRHLFKKNQFNLLCFFHHNMLAISPLRARQKNSLSFAKAEIMGAFMLEFIFNTELIFNLCVFFSYSAFLLWGDHTNNRGWLTLTPGSINHNTQNVIFYFCV